MDCVRLAIVGGRDFSDYAYMQECLRKYRETHTVIQVVSGGARGADSLGERWAVENGIERRIFPADWNRYGKSAGFRRNRDIVAGCDAVAAFWDGRSRGTENTIALARAAGKPVTIYKY
jgi:predicted Rossmann fold nucleotide-binding protein DprA/Smf involved in DNA uptake